MPEPIVKEEGKQDNDVKVDAFGSPINGEPQLPPSKDEGGEGDKGKKDTIVIPDDHPTIVALKAQIEQVKNEYGSNLSGQREVIKNLEAKLKEFGEKKQGEDKSYLPFKPEEIVFSKDLSKEKLDDMTDNEIKLHDELMKNRQIMNQQAEERRNAELDGVRKAEETNKVTDLNASVRSIALELAGNDTAIANAIIESSKQFNLAGLNEADLRIRIENSAKLVPNYKPKTEPVTKRGGVAPTDGGGADPFGTDKILAEVEGKRSGKTFSL